MKFCKFCGKQLDDNAVCDCQASVQANQQVTFTAPQPQQPQVSPYAVNTNGQPAGEGKFVKSLKNLPIIFTSYWKNAKQTVEIAKKENDLIVAGLFSAIFFIGILIANCCFYGALDSMTGGYLSIFNFGKIFVSSILVTVVAVAMYVLIKFATVKIFVRQSDTKRVFFDAFIEFAINSIPVTILLIVAGLFSFFALYISAFLLVFAIIFLITLLISEIKTAVPYAKNNFLFVLLTSVFLTIALAVVCFVLVRMFFWCSGIDELMNTASDLASNFAGNFMDLF